MIELTAEVVVAGVAGTASTFAVTDVYAALVAGLRRTSFMVGDGTDSTFDFGDQ